MNTHEFTLSAYGSFYKNCGICQLPASHDIHMPAFKRLSHACQYANCNHCSGCPCHCHKIITRRTMHLDNPAASFKNGDQ